MIGRHFLVALSLALAWGAACDRARAEPVPGDVFRQYVWRAEGKWQRVTGPDTTEARARAFLPNAVNRVRIDDLEGATRVEAYLEMLLCHGGTVGKKIRLNGKPWIAIPESERIPGEAGQGPPDSEYQSMRYPSVEIPLSDVRQGDNTFELTCGGGTALGGWWPQWILYGVTFRVYYDQAKPHPTGAVVAPVPGATLADSPILRATAAGPLRIERVDFLGHYEDFDTDGDGTYHEWHWRSLYGDIAGHIGSATEAPYEVTWDNRWVPSQQQPIKVAARIVDSSGMCYLTEAVENVRLARSKTVRMYKPYDVPKRWSTRAGKTHRCKLDVPDDLSEAVAARISMATWNGVAADEIGINGEKVIGPVGKNHDLSYDSFPVPLDLIRPGTNEPYTSSATEHHGIEVQWPGMVLLIMYDRAERAGR